VLIVGASSAIATEVGRAYAEQGASLFLAGRKPERLAAVAGDLGVRGAAHVETMALDVLARHRHAELVERAFASGGLDIAVIAHGVLPDQSQCEESAEEAVRAIEVNFTGTVALLTLLANRFEAQGRGTIAVIASVAGDRGRQSNYVYGASKAGLHVFLQGLRNRLHRSGVSVVTLKPGFVDTPMTAGMPRNPLFASSRRAGRAIFRAIEARRDVAYIPWFWRPIMALITSLPEFVFKRLRL
jgi:short-subunit dehydrogenase